MITIKIATSPPILIQTAPLKGSMNKLFWKDSGGSRNTNFGIIGIGCVMYCIKWTRARLMNDTVPENYKKKTSS